MSIATVAAVESFEAGNAPTTEHPGVFYWQLINRGSGKWDYGFPLLSGWLPIAYVDLAWKYLAKHPREPSNPTTDTAYILLSNDPTSVSSPTWYWHTFTSDVPSAAQQVAAIEATNVIFPLAYSANVGFDLTPAAQVGRARPPVSEVKGLRRLSWRRWLSLIHISEPTRPY